MPRYLHTTSSIYGGFPPSFTAPRYPTACRACHEPLTPYIGGKDLISSRNSVISSRKRHTFIFTSYDFIQHSYRLFRLIRRVHHTEKKFITLSFRHIHTTYMHAAYWIHTRCPHHTTSFTACIINPSCIIRRCHIMISYSIIITCIIQAHI